MKEIDRLLEQWIPVNTIIREEIKKVIQLKIDISYERGVESGLDYKQNTNTNG